MMVVKKVRKVPRAESGQAMVEFLLVTVLVLVVFVSMIQMIILMYGYNTLADAAKMGVRYAIVHGTGVGQSNCSGPGTATGVTPSVACTDSAGANVVTTVIGASSTCAPTCGFALLSFQNIAASDVTVDYTTNNPKGGCSAAGCYVKVTVSHVYTPLFNLGWPSLTLNAAADGRIMD